MPGTTAASPSRSPRRPKGRQERSRALALQIQPAVGRSEGFSGGARIPDGAREDRTDRGSAHRADTPAGATDASPPALPPATRSGPEPNTSPPELPYQAHGAEEDPGEGGQLVQDPQVLQLGLGSGDLTKDMARAITTSVTSATSPHRHRGAAGRAGGLTLVPPGWFWWALSCCERDLRRLFSLTSCSSEGGRKGSRPHSFLREGAASTGAPRVLGTAAGEPCLGDQHGDRRAERASRQGCRRRASSCREREPELQLGVTAAAVRALAWVPMGMGCTAVRRPRRHVRFCWANPQSSFLRFPLCMPSPSLHTLGKATLRFVWI